jgi:protein TonB
MLAYAANRPVTGNRQSSPNALLVVIGVHVALLAVVMSAKMDLPGKITDPPIKIFRVPPDPVPPPQPVRAPTPRPHLTQTVVDNPPPKVPIEATHPTPVDTGPTVDPTPLTGAGTNIITEVPRPKITPVHHDPRLLTPPSELKPPYPASKLLTEEEAVLNLRLTIDENGRVVAVDPVGRADAAFLDAARRHLLKHWRYQPATDDGRAVSSSLTVTLRFMLDA